MGIPETRLSRGVPIPYLGSGNRKASLVDGKEVIIYVCDPLKNLECANRENCQIECFYTVEAEYAEDPVEAVKLLPWKVTSNTTFSYNYPPDVKECPSCGVKTRKGLWTCDLCNAKCCHTCHQAIPNPDYDEYSEGEVPDTLIICPKCDKG